MKLTEDASLVSIGMPVRNCGKTLDISIKSILSQSYNYWELLIIDDGSEDDTVEVAKKYSDHRIRIYLDGEKRGIEYRLNQALGLSSGKYFARMDGDDVAYPSRLERQVLFLEKHLDIDLLGTWVMVFKEDGQALGKRMGPENHKTIIAKPIAGFPIAHPTYMGRLTWFQRYKYRNEALLCEDQDLLLRSHHHSRFANYPEILLGYREKQISLKKIILSRKSWVQSLSYEFKRKGEYGLFLRGALEQGMKGIVDCISVLTGLNYHILRHRARPITDEEKKEWEGIWKLLGKGLILIQK
jgi:glycosyltransferase involved in cell wall biosynthesis